MNFHETCKVLVNTETAYRDGAPHLLVTGIGSYTQGLAGSVEFDYEDVYMREDNYNDVVGFYHTHPSGLNQMSPTDVQTMTQWVSCLGKSLICLIETDEQINGWMFIKSEHEITCREVNVHSGNDVNYDIWLEKQGQFWSPADFLMEENFEEEMEEEEDAIEKIQEALEDISQTQDSLMTGFGMLSSLVEQMIVTMTKDDDDEDERT